MRIPAQCQAPGCGLILLLHGDTGTGLLMDAHVKMRDLGQEHGYLVVAPTGPPLPSSVGFTWHQSNDATLVDIVNLFKSVFPVDPRKIHVTGFSRGGFVTWRLLCDHADLFASAAPAAAGYGDRFPEPEMTCFQNGRVPSRKIPILFLMGRKDVRVIFLNMVNIRDAAITNYGATAPTVLDCDARYTHVRWTSSDGATIETFDHEYNTHRTGQFASFEGHCIVGSPIGPSPPQFAFACEPPNAFVWGEQVMQFFMAHPMP